MATATIHAPRPQWLGSCRGGGGRRAGTSHRRRAPASLAPPNGYRFHLKQYPRDTCSLRAQRRSLGSRRVLLCFACTSDVVRESTARWRCSFTGLTLLAGPGASGIPDRKADSALPRGRWALCGTHLARDRLRTKSLHQPECPCSALAAVSWPPHPYWWFLASAPRALRVGSRTGLSGWSFPSRPEAQTDTMARALASRCWPRRKVLGGSSASNGHGLSAR